MSQPSLVEARGITLRYGSEGKSAVTALEDVSLSIEQGQFVALLGPSGCGKSTLLYLLGGFLKPSEGQIFVGGVEVKEPGPERGIVFQHFALFPWKTVMGNVEYGLRIAGRSRSRAQQEAKTYIELVGLKGFQDSYPSQLSGGMKQRAAIARTLALDPKILLMDEPFGALDAQTRGMLQEELLRIWRRTGKTIVFVTHDVQEAVLLADKIALMSARPGSIVTVLDNPLDKFDPDLATTREFSSRVSSIWHFLKTGTFKQAGA